MLKEFTLRTERNNWINITPQVLSALRESGGSRGGGAKIRSAGAGGLHPGPASHRAAEARHGAAWYAAISADIWDR